MAVLGSTSKPTTSQEAFGLNSTNQMAQALTLPAGGPWRIYRLGGWIGGWNDSPRAKLCLWTAAATIQRSGAQFTVLNHGNIVLGGTTNYEQDITDYVVPGGTTVYVGWWRHSDDATQNGHTGSGTHLHDTAGDAPESMSGWSSHTGGIGSYLYYEASNSPPTAPTPTSPGSGAIVNDTTPLLDWTHNDPDGDVQSGYQVQVDDSSGFGSPAWDSGSVTSSTSSATTGGLNRGTTYYWRVRTRDASGTFGPYSAARTFKVASLPTATVTSPGTDTTAPLYYTGGSDTTPKLKPVWTFSCPDGGTQTSASIKVYDAAGTSLLHTHAHSGAATTASLSGYAPTNGTIYQIAVTPVCSHGPTGNESAKKRFRVRWGRASYRADLGAAPLSLSATAATTTNSGQVIVEYASSAATTPEPTDWKATIAEVTKQRYVWHRVTLLPAVAAAPTSPTLNSVVFTYSNNVLAVDDWAMPSNASVDLGTFVYGTQSLKMVNDGTIKHLTQTVAVVPDTNYMLSGRIKTQGQPAASIRLRDPDDVTTLAIVSADPDADWVRYSVPWNSGSATSVQVTCSTSSSGGVVDDVAWFDALKLEASTVVTPWTPGFLASAVTLDAGGIMVDGSLGGVLRMRGTAGGTRDTVKLGANGLVFGDDVEIFSPAANVLRVPTLRVGNYPNLNSSYVGEGLLELRGGTPYIDFANDNAIDYDARLRLTSDDVLAVEGANFSATLVSTLGSTAYTPVMGNDGTAAYSVVHGSYFRLGKIVFVRMYFVVSTAGSGTGILSVTTPSTPDRSGGSVRQVLNGHLEGSTGNNGPINVVTLAGDSGATWSRIRQSEGGANLTGASLVSGAILNIQGWYEEA